MPVEPPLLVAALEMLVPVALAATTAYVWRRRRGPSRRPFLALLAAVTVLAATNGLVRNVESVAGVTGIQKYLLLVRLLGSVAVVVTVAWFVFALEYTGRGALVTRETLGVLAVPAVLHVGARWSLPLLEPGTGLTSVLAFLGFVSYPLLLSSGFVAAFLLLRAATAYDHLPVGLALSLTAGGVLASLVPLATGVTAPFGSGREFVVGGLLVVTAAVWVALFRYRPFQMLPGAGHLGRERAVQEMDDGVVVLDRNGRVVELNPTVERAFDVEQSAATGRPVDEALGVDPTRALAADGPAVLETPDARRQFELTRSRLTDRGGQLIGHVLLARDVTERRNRERRLAVLAGVLQDALRDGMADVQRAAREIPTDGIDPGERAADVQGTVERLSTLGREARRIERVMAEQPWTEPVDVADAGRAVAAEPRPGTDVTVDAPAECWLRSDRTVLEAVLETVVEDAVERCASDEPSVAGAPDDAVERCASGDAGVSVTVVRAGDRVVVSVAGDGPPIPEQGRTLLRKGTRTPPRDAAGLGRWFVNWGVERLGGDVDVTVNDPRGSVVTMRLPDARDPERDGPDARGRNS